MSWTGSSRRPPWVSLAALGLVLVAGIPAIGMTQETFGAHEAGILLKGLSYDRALPTRGGGALRIAVVHAADGRAEAEQAATLLAAAGPGGKATATAIAFSSVAQLMTALEKEGSTVLFVHRSATSIITSLTQVSRGRKLPTLAHDAAMVNRGLAMGVRGSGASARLVVNLRAAKVEGMDLPAAVLAAAMVIP